MKLLDLLIRGGVAGTLLVSWLERLKELSPDLAPEIDAEIAKLNGAIGEPNVLEVLGALAPEVKKIAQLKLAPRDHPSDAV